MTTHQVEACYNSEFHKIKCLESSEEYGFFKDENDIRPSMCTWIKKDNAEKLFGLFRKEDRGFAREELKKELCAGQPSLFSERKGCNVCGRCKIINSVLGDAPK